MQITADWTYLTTTPEYLDGVTLTHESTALRQIDNGLTIMVTHVSRDMTTVDVFENYEGGFRFENYGKAVDSGAHRSPAEALRFADAYAADAGDDFRRPSVSRISPRYSRSVSMAYAH